MYNCFTAAVKGAVALLLLAAATSARSNENPDAVHPGTLAAQGDTVSVRWEDVRPALRDHPAWKEADSRSEQAVHQVSTARAWTNPALGARLGRSKGIDEGGLERIWEVDVGVPVPIPGARSAKIAASEAERQVAHHEAEARRRQAEAEVRTEFWRLVYHQERFVSLRQRTAQTRELVEVARLRVQAGEARPMELRQFEIELARVHGDLAEAAVSEETGRELLRLWLGSALPDAYRVEGDLSAVPAIPPLHTSLETIPSRQSDAQAAGERMRAAEALVKGARAERFADLEVGGFYERERDSKSYGAGLELRLPLWNWNGAAIDAARAGQAGARHAYELALANAEAAVRKQHAAATAAVARVRSLRDAVVPRSVEVASATEQMYRIGEIDALHVLDARRGLSGVQEEALLASLEAQLSVLELALLTGDTIP